jgi:hypothetical protein
VFVDGILENRPVAPSFYDGWKAQQIIDAAIISSERGCWVDIEKDTGLAPDSSARE